MAEYIDKVSFNYAIREAVRKYPNSFYNGLEVARQIAHDFPAADVRPVVLCRDCKHKGWVQEPEHGKSVDYCRLIERCVDKQFFCAAGDMREES